VTFLVELLLLLLLLNGSINIKEKQDRNPNCSDEEVKFLLNRDRSSTAAN